MSAFETEVFVDALETNSFLSPARFPHRTEKKGEAARLYLAHPSLHAPDNSLSVEFTQERILTEVKTAMSNLISSITRFSTAMTLFTVDQLERSVKIVSNGDSMSQAVEGFEKTLN